MIWRKAGALHWKSEDSKPYIAEVKLIRTKAGDFAVWRVSGPGFSATGRRLHPVEAMTQAAEQVGHLLGAKREAEERERLEFSGNVKSVGMA